MEIPTTTSSSVTSHSALTTFTNMNFKFSSLLAIAFAIAVAPLSSFAMTDTSGVLQVHSLPASVCSLDLK